LALKRTFLCLILIALSVLIVPHRKSAADDWLPIDPAELKMTSEPKAPGAPAIYLYRQVDRKDAGRTGRSEMNYVRIKILTDEGRKNGNVEIIYPKHVSGISGIRARTIHPDGSIANFDGKTFDTTVQKSKTEKYLAKTFTLPDVQVGSIIEYRYNIDMDDSWIFDSHWIVGEDLFTKKAVFTLRPYERWAVKWDWPAGLPAGTNPPKQDPDGTIRMTAVDVPPFSKEDYMPPEHELRFRVDFIYSEEGFEDNPDKFWKKYGKKQYEVTEKFMDKHKAMEDAVSQVVSPADSAEAKLRKIYARCQQVNNLGFVRSTEWVKYDKVKRDNVEDVWKNGVGFGQDINLLFLALARAAGFQGNYLRLSARSDYFFTKQLMNTAELDADAVLIKLDGKDLYLDPATKFAPFGLLPWMETGVMGLALDKDGGHWIDTVIPESSESKIMRQADLKLDDDGSLKGTVNVTYTGLEALNLRLGQRFTDDTEKKTDLEEQLKDHIPVNAQVELKNKPEWNSSDDKLVAEFDVDIPGWCSSAGKRALVPLGIFSGAQRHTFEHADRKYAIYFTYLFQTEDHSKITIPAGWKVDSLPKEVHIDAKAAEFRIAVTGKDNTLDVTRTFRSDLLLLQASFYPNLRTFYQQVRSGDEAQAVLLPGASSASR
jgi:Domain of Unknown Function with PDB structure (DUF3857)/Domain of Unknown Function with PDB structure (DUF3858)